MRRKTQIDKGVSHTEYDILMLKTSMTEEAIAKKFNITKQEVTEIFDKYDGFEIRGRIIF